MLVQNEPPAGHIDVGTTGDATGAARGAGHLRDCKEIVGWEGDINPFSSSLSI
jgi:hypothetical protein